MKKVISILLVVVFVFSFVACGASKENVVGTWKGQYVIENSKGFMNGVVVNYWIKLDEDGRYSRGRGTGYTDAGEWTIKFGKLVLNSDDGYQDKWKYKNGKLDNSLVTFEKQ